MTNSNILSVDSLDLEFLESDSSKLCINAAGTVSSISWVEAQLIPVVNSNGLEDGILEFDFVATPPDGDELMTIGTVFATYTVDALTAGIKSIRVNATQNKMEKSIGNH